MARGRTTQGSAGSAVSTQPEFASVEDRPPRPGRVRPAKRARFGTIVLTVLLTEIVLIGAGVNQAVAKHLETFAVDHRHGLSGQLVRSLLVLRWSIAPQSHHPDLWHAELITVGLTILLSLALVAFVVHGPITWLQSFFGTWLAVTIATTLATVAGLVLSDLEQSADFAYYVVPGTPSARLSLSQQLQRATFGEFLPRGFVAGVLLGFVVAVIVSIVAVSTRRTDPLPVADVAAPEAVAPPEAPEAFFGAGGSESRTDYDRSSYGQAPYGQTPYGQAPYGQTPYGQASYGQTPYSGSDRAQDSPTTTLPAVEADADADSNATTALPSITAYRPFDPPRGETPAEPAATLEPTQPAGTPEPTEPAATPEPTDAAAPVGESEAAQTQAWPAQPERTQQEPEGTAARSEPADEQTTAFPLPPDDEDLGHHPERTDD